MHQVPVKELLRSSLFVLLSITSAVGPSILISLFSYEFPSLIGGLLSVVLTGLLIRFKVGLRPYTAPQPAITRQRSQQPTLLRAASGLSAKSLVGQKSLSRAECSASFRWAAVCVWWCAYLCCFVTR